HTWLRFGEIMRGSLSALYNKAGVNGLFTDFPDKAVKFLNKE
ncbi:hypothetical protein, partial [Escherichia coli]